MRDGGRIVSLAAIIAVAATTDGRREIVGLGVGPSKAEPFWSTFLKGQAGDRARREGGMIRRAAAMLEGFANHPT
jgi:hypothetical protein